MAVARPSASQRWAGEGDPERGRVLVHVRQADIAVSGVLVGVELDLLVAHHLLGHDDVSPPDRERLEGRLVLVLEHPHLHVGLGGGEVVRLDEANEGLVVVVVELLDLVLQAVVLVDGLLVEHGVGRVPVELGDRQPRLDVDDDGVVPAHASQAHVVGGEGLLRPVVAIAAPVHDAVIGQEAECALGVVGRQAAVALVVAARAARRRRT